MSKSKKKPGRRKFIIRTLAGGVGVLALGTYLFRANIRRKLAYIAHSVEGPPYMGDTGTPLIWFETTPDDKIIFYSPKVEMGQGSLTGLSQLAAEELGIPINQLITRHAPTEFGNVDEFATGGSTSISSLWVPLRELAATMRVMLENEAARKWQVNPKEVSLKGGLLHHGSKSMTLSDTIADVSSWEIPDTPELKPRSEFQLIGKPVPRVDLFDKVFGAPIFGMDAEIPGMVFASVTRPTYIDSKFIKADTTAARKMPGVIEILEEDDFVAVIAETFYQAERAKEMVEVQWEIKRKWQTEDIEAIIQVGQGTPFEIQLEGNPEARIKEAGEIFSRSYSSPIGAHAQLEPNGAVAYVEEDKATVILSTQAVNLTRKQVADKVDMDKDQVNIIPTFLGGGFGRRLNTPNAAQAAYISKKIGKPVKCFFSRKEEFQNDTFRPPTHHVLNAVLSENGKILALEHHTSSGDVAFGSPLMPPLAEPLFGADLGAWRGGMIQYEKIPDFRTVSWRVKLPFATSWWRSLGLLANTFAIESFMDELAIKAGKNPVQYRLDHIADGERGNRLKQVIQAAGKAYQEEVSVEKAWGFAASTDVNTPCAQAVQVGIVEGEIKVLQVYCVIDPGLVVNPDQVRAQCEGAINMGISASLYEEMRIVDSSLQPVIYGPYRMALLKDAPAKIEIEILENADKPGAVGEPPLGPIGAAISNAVFRLSGKRLRKMPLQQAMNSITATA